jgi:hypothetical protein
MRVLIGSLKDLALGEHFLWPAQTRRRMDLFEAGERLVQIHTSAGRPNKPYGACHMLSLDCYKRYGRAREG